MQFDPVYNLENLSVLDLALSGVSGLNIVLGTVILDVLSSKPRKKNYADNAIQ